MAVVVGKAATPTPTLSAEMTHLIFSPYWNIPESILANEMLPQAFQDKNYLSRQNIEVVRVVNGKREVVNPSSIDWANVSNRSDYHFRQRPGPGNSLGLVKFIFPNPYSVYLHDTPADSLFNLPERDFSHGCVRVEKPLELASYLLSDQPQWPRERIEAAMHSGDETAVKLGQKIPVYMIYVTAWGAADGTVHFRKDIYNRDKRATT
jgi:murein L,D-transpeptidase YcbB/YkuD